VDSDAGTCTVRYDYYNNEEVQRIDSLLPPSDVHATRQRTYNSSTASDVSLSVNVSYYAINIHRLVIVSHCLLITAGRGRGRF